MCNSFSIANELSRFCTTPQRKWLFCFYMSHFHSESSTWHYAGQGRATIPLQHYTLVNTAQAFEPLAAQAMESHGRDRGGETQQKNYVDKHHFCDSPQKLITGITKVENAMLFRAVKQDIQADHSGVNGFYLV